MLEVIIILWLLFWVAVGGIAGAMIFSSKGRTAWVGALIGLVIGWWIILALLVPESTEQRVRKEEETRARMREMYKESD